MKREEILSVLIRWNIWGKARKGEAIPRESIQKIVSLKNYHGAIVIKGPRRAGKSTLLYQLMEDFSKGAIQKACCM